MAAGYPDFPGPVYSVADRPGLVWTRFDLDGSVLNAAGDAEFESLEWSGTERIPLPFGADLRASVFLALPTPVRLYGAMIGQWGQGINSSTTHMRYALDGGSPDASWVNFDSKQQPATAGWDYQAYRNSIYVPSSPVDDVLGVSLFRTTPQTAAGSGVLSRIVLFAEPMVPEGLQFWHPTNNEILPGNWFEGDVMEASADTRTVAFRVRNGTGTSVAAGATISLDIEQVPGNTLEYAFSTDGGSTWGSVATLDSINSSAIHPQIHFRVTPTVGVSSLDKTDFKLKINVP